MSETIVSAEKGPILIPEPRVQDVAIVAPLLLLSWFAAKYAFNENDGLRCWGNIGIFAASLYALLNIPQPK